jgi:hypothetical protein
MARLLLLLLPTTQPPLGEIMGPQSLRSILLSFFCLVLSSACGETNHIQISEQATQKDLLRVSALEKCHKKIIKAFTANSADKRQKKLKKAYAKKIQGTRCEDRYSHDVIAYLNAEAAKRAIDKKAVKDILACINEVQDIPKCLQQDCSGTWGGNQTIDCNGDCGDNAIVDACGVCGGDNADDLGCGCFMPGPSGCDAQCGSTLEIDACGICGGDNVDDLGCGCFLPGPSGCDAQCGSTLGIDACGICGGDNADDLGCGCFLPGPSGCDTQCGSTLEIDE